MIKERQFNPSGSILTIPSITDSIGPSILPKDDPRDLKVILIFCLIYEPVSSPLLLTSGVRESFPRSPSRRPPSLPPPLASQRAFVVPGCQIIHSHSGCSTKVSQTELKRVCGGCIQIDQDRAVEIHYGLKPRQNWANPNVAINDKLSGNSFRTRIHWRKVYI